MVLYRRLDLQIGSSKIYLRRTDNNSEKLDALTHPVTFLL